MRRKLRIGCGAAGALLVLLLAYLLLWPVPVEPVAWTPAEAPALEGEYALNDALAAAERLAVDGEGPEDVAVDADGRIYGGLVDGRIVVLEPDGSGQRTLVDTGGRPLGLDFDAAGDLVVADAEKGLLKVTPDGELTVLATEHGGIPFGFTDDLDVGPDGVIYFSDASSKFGYHEVFAAAIENGTHGRLLAFDPSTGSTRLLVDGLAFANGVAVSAAGDYVLYNETWRYRTSRYWLSGPNAGQTEIVADNLPGFPDGVSTGTGDRFWVALYSPRLSDVDSMLPSPWIRKVVMRLPSFLQPAPKSHGFVLGIDASGNVVTNLQHDDPDSFSPITSVEEVDGTLYLGSLTAPAIARLPLPPR